MITLIPAAVVAAAPVRHAGGSVLSLIVLMLAAGAIWAAGYALSVRVHPYRPCRDCGESGKHRGMVFTHSFRACARCGGTGMELRRFARRP